MEHSAHIAVFARAPVPGEAKTRLIPSLGPGGAAAAQRSMTLRTLATACAAAPGRVSLWTAGDPHHPFFNECAQRFGVDLFPQPEGDLGARMAACLRAVLQSHEAALLIGTDCPAFTPGDLLAAEHALRQGARMVFTPAEDGGYVLVGARRVTESGEHWLEQAFSSIVWSTAAVMRQTRERLSAIGWQAGIDWIELPALWDVDTPEDFRRALQFGLRIGEA